MNLPATSDNGLLEDVDENIPAAGPGATLLCAFAKLYPSR